jgi:hypothetical protein
MGLLALVASLLAAVVCVPFSRLKKPFAKPLAIVLGGVLFVFFSWAGFVLLIVVSARAGHPF